MKDFAIVTNSSGAWPNVTAQNETIPGAKDGTALQESWLTDLWGFVQAVMFGANNTTPSGGAETSTVSQILQAIRAHCGVAGEVVAWMGPTVPTGVRLLILTGQIVAQADYPQLVVNTYCGDLNNNEAPAFYKCSAGGVKGTGEAYFKLPDLRGYFLRGIDATQTIDPDSDRIAMPGSVQTALVKEHSHDGLINDDQPVRINQVFEAGTNRYGVAEGAGGDAVTTLPSGTGIGPDNRPVNVSAYWAIRY
jgi:hypothetical protein